MEWFFSGGIWSPLDVLFQMSVPYDHHKENYEGSLLEEIVTGLKLNKLQAFKHVSENFPFQWSNILFDAENKLV